MNNLSDIILFAITTVVVMLFVQAYRIARYIKDTEEDDYPMFITIPVVIFSPSTTYGVGVIRYYIDVLSGSYLSKCHKYPAAVVEEVRDTGGIEQLEKELYFIREYFYPNIVEIMLSASTNKREFRRAADILLSEIFIADKGPMCHPFITAVENQICDIAKIENTPRDEVVELLCDYIKGLGDGFIERKIKENKA